MRRTRPAYLATMWVASRLLSRATVEGRREAARPRRRVGRAAVGRPSQTYRPFSRLAGTDTTPPVAPRRLCPHTRVDGGVVLGPAPRDTRPAPRLGPMPVRPSWSEDPATASAGRRPVTPATSCQQVGPALLGPVETIRRRLPPYVAGAFHLLGGAANQTAPDDHRTLPPHGATVEDLVVDPFLDLVDPAPARTEAAGDEAAGTHPSGFFSHLLVAARGPVPFRRDK